MKRKTIYFLVMLMAMSLVGIIWVQWYWINNGLKIKEQQFDQLVSASLNDIVSSLEDKESASFITKQLNSVTSDVIVKADSLSNHFVWTSNIADSLNIVSVDGNGSDISVKVESVLDSVMSGNRKLKTTKKVIINNEVLSEDVDITTEKILGERFDNVIVKMIKEFKHRDNPIEHLIGKTNLDTLIADKLTQNGVTANFSYAILDEDSILNKYSSKDYELTQNNYQIALFKHDISKKPTLFSLSFPNKKMSILKSMWVMVVVSILFTLIILICFSGAIYYMFKQKKVAEIKNDFINNMTHEFKTPISTISLAIDSITHPKIIDDKTQINYYADIIRKENKRMNSQVESVLNTSLAEKNELGLTISPINLIAFLEKINTRMELQLKNANCEFKINNKAGDIIINIDEAHFQNAICNLLDNAIKYSNSNPKVELNINLQNNHLQFTIIDNGIGMSKEAQKKVFDKFYRVQTGNIHNVKGFGIGLSYVKAIVEAHRGTINIQSKLNQGTTISINLPQ